MLGGGAIGVYSVNYFLSSQDWEVWALKASADCIILVIYFNWPAGNWWDLCYSAVAGDFISIPGFLIVLGFGNVGVIWSCTGWILFGDKVGKDSVF